jgi:ABC-2 type transport system ATP-binding protein
MNILEIENVNKSFAVHKVLDSISIGVAKGQIFGLLGPNGAGKTTMMRLITRIMLPDSGTIRIDGEIFTKAHVRKIGYMPEERGLYRNMQVAEHLRYFAKLHGIDKAISNNSIDNWLEKLGLSQVANRFVGELSKGMSQKVQFIATILHNPSILILDEPFSGLDPISSQALEAEILQLKQAGLTIILSTHRMDQIENFCDNVFLINKGKKILEGKISDLKDKYKEGVVQILTGEKIPADLLGKYNVILHKENIYYIKIGNDDMKKNLLQQLLDNSISIIGFNEVLPSMQEVFIKSVNGNQS